MRAKADAEGLVREVRRQELAGVNVLEAVKSARAATPTAAPSQFPSVKTAVLDFIETQVKAGELRESTALNYRNRARGEARRSKVLWTARSPDCRDEARWTKVL